ncbi:hypothetical protein [Streptomyces sp. NPDC093105]|uniref:hypothetical protein n=1 Tax=Streptomyces sp. NPDC093105 TaxID=3366029 RepID=UPI00382306E0
MQNERYFIAGQSSWDATGIGSAVSSLDGPLEGIGAIWVFCDPTSEGDAWAATLPRLSRTRILTWSARLRPRGWEPPQEDDSHSLLWRSGPRARAHQFHGLPWVESRYQSFSNSESAVRELSGALAVRSSGFAYAVGDSRGRDEDLKDAWIQAAQIMESHFSLSRDFENSPLLESRRRRITNLYVTFCVEVGIFPLIPLNKHPNAGFVLFCPTVDFPDVFRRMTEGARHFEGGAATTRIREFIDHGGDLAYL